MVSDNGSPLMGTGWSSGPVKISGGVGKLAHHANLVEVTVKFVFGHRLLRSVILSGTLSRSSVTVDAMDLPAPSLMAECAVTMLA